MMDLSFLRVLSYQKVFPESMLENKAYIDYMAHPCLIIAFTFRAHV